MSNNLPKEKEKVNNPFKQISDKAIDELMYSKPLLFTLLVHIKRHYCTFKYGLVGVHKKLTQSQVAKDLKINKQNVMRGLNTLQEMGFIKIYHQTPILMQFIDIDDVPHIKDITDLISLFYANKNDFYIHEKDEWKIDVEVLFKDIVDSMIEEQLKVDPFGYTELQNKLNQLKAKI